MTLQEIIAVRRDGGRHTQQELEFLARAAADGSGPDYQLSAWLMAAYLHPLDDQETAWLTEAMAASGERLDLTGLPHPWVDKHSTGGVGDKTSVVLLPLLTSCGLTMVKMSGRGLGITGGTVDKLASVPGFRLDLSPEEMKAQAARVGVALTGQTPRLAPADKSLYALRDATGTVRSIPLIVSSILSKKLAGGAEVVVLDVKAGSGAFMKSVDEARELQSALARTAGRIGLKVEAVLTDMDQPLGRCVGNALEVAEAFEVLSGRERGRFWDLCVGLAATALQASGKSPSRAEALAAAEASLESGRALEKAREWFDAQGARVTADGRVEGLPSANRVIEVANRKGAGWVARVDAWEVGDTVVDLGGGRRSKEDAVDLAVGVECLCQVGDRVAPGEPMFRIHAAGEAAAEAAAVRLEAAWQLAEKTVAPRPVFL